MCFTQPRAVTVAGMFLNNWISRFGCMVELLSDQCSEFESILIGELCHLMEINKIRTSPFRPSTNGCVERFHRTLNSLIGKVFSKDNQKDLEVLLPTVMAAYRASVHSSTWFIPNRIILGKEVHIPLDIAMGLPLEEVRLPNEYTTCVMKREADLHYTYDLVRKELKRCSNRRKCYYDAHV